MENSFFGDKRVLLEFDKRDQEFEKWLLNCEDQANTIEYIKEVIDGRWPEAEPILMKTEYAVYYAAKFIKGRWLEAEPYIIKNPILAYRYAEEVIEGRGLEAEQAIMTDPECTIAYALEIIKGRWIEAEPFIKTSPACAAAYAIGITKMRWKDIQLELRILECTTELDYIRNPSSGYWQHSWGTGVTKYVYAKMVAKKSWKKLYAEVTAMNAEITCCDSVNLVGVAEE